MSKLGSGIGAQTRKRSRINGYVTEVDGKSTQTRPRILVFEDMHFCIIIISGRTEKRWDLEW